VGVARSIPSQILPKAPILDPNIQIHKMLVEFTTRLCDQDQNTTKIHPWKTRPMM